MGVRMRHDGIEQEITVPEISVRVYERSGWKRSTTSTRPLEKEQETDGGNSTAEEQ